MRAPAQTTPDAEDPTASADPIALAAFVARRGGRVLAYLDAVTSRERALTAAGEAFAGYRRARAADPEAEAAATALLRATRRAASAHAENPFRPDGRERSARRTTACEAMPRLLVAWTESRLPDDAVERLVQHLQECPDCRALRDAFDRAELGYRAGEAAALDGVEVGLIATAMARATTPAPDGAVAAPAATEVPAPRAGTRRTAVPAAPTDDATLAPRPRRPAPTGRRTAVPAPPPPLDLPAPAGDRPQGRDVPPSPTRSSGRPGDAPDDPTGPEALGYAVPRTGLPRPARRPAVPRVRRRRARRPPSAAVAAASVEHDAPVPRDPGAADRPDAQADPGTHDATTTSRAPDATGTSRGSGTPAASRVGDDAPAGRTTEDRAAVSPDAADRDRDPAPEDRASAVDDPVLRDDPRPDHDAADRQQHRPAAPAVAPATVASGGLQATGRRVLAVPIVRQLGVPAVLLLVVLIAALIAAGVFAGQSEDSVPPISSPTLPSIPADPTQIPPLD